jgi:FixJ family two-component response regulator
MVPLADAYPTTRKRKAPAVLEPVVYVVDDDISVRESLEAMLGFAGWRFMAFSSAQAFLDHTRDDAPACLVLDINLPDLNGLDLQRQLLGETRVVPIIFITGYGDIPSTVQAMKAGALEFLTKPFDADTLLDAIAGAIEASRQALNAKQAAGKLQAAFGTLTGREREVMTMVVAGSMNKQIAMELGISEITVKAHRGKVMRKMRARTLVELVEMASVLRSMS